MLLSCIEKDKSKTLRSVKIFCIGRQVQYWSGVRDFIRTDDPEFCIFRSLNPTQRRHEKMFDGNTPMQSQSTVSMHGSTHALGDSLLDLN